MRFYNIDLVKSGFKNEITWRKFLILLRSLPEESAYYRFTKNKENRNFVEYREDEIEKEIEGVK